MEDFAVLRSREPAEDATAAVVDHDDLETHALQGGFCQQGVGVVVKRHVSCDNPGGGKFAHASTSSVPAQRG